ncbi:MAG: hypothetical protein ISR91_03050, partial [Candidatus Delongbacteria bacterium]|nr:hypothetical protein [Candidatus Delongbacteria bacterium]
MYQIRPGWFRWAVPWIITCLSLTILSAAPVMEGLPAGDPDSLLTAWSGRDLPEYLLLRGHLAEAAEADADARADWLEFLDRYPFHPRTSYIHYRLGRNYAIGGSWQAGLDHLVPLLEGTSDAALQERIKLAICELYQRLDPAAATQFTRRLPAELVDRCRAAAATARGNLLILPLTGATADQGKDLARSIRIGQELWGIEAAYRTVDNRSDPLVHARILAELATDRDWTIFQTTTPEMLAPLHLLDRTHVICPDRSQPATPALHTISLQLDPQLQARTLAVLALDTLGMHAFALLAPADSLGRTLAREFSSIAAARGDTVLFTSYFFPGSDDIGKQLTEMRLFGLNLDFRDSLLWSFADTVVTDSAAARGLDWSRADTLWRLDTLGFRTSDWSHSGDLHWPADTSGRRPVCRLFFQRDTLFAVAPPDSLPLPLEIIPDLFSAYEKEHPSKSCPVRAFDAIFFALHQEDVSHMATQLAFYHFEALLLGNEFWVDWTTREEAGRLMRGMIAPLPFAPSEQVD